MLLRGHAPALAVFIVLATLFLWDVLLLSYSLGAFDIILSQPSWKDEFLFRGIHQPILSDSPAAHYPQRELEWGHAGLLKNVELNPYIFTGMPWSPQGVGGFITSLPQLFLGVKEAIDWSTWLRLVCAGFFMYLLMVELGTGRLSGVFAGILWTYSLHQMVWLEFPQHLATQLWIPLVFLFSIRILTKGPDARSLVALLVVNVLFFTSGYMQIVLYTYVAVGLFNTFYVLAGIPGGDFGRGARRWMAVHLVYITAVGLCAAGLLAEIQSLSEGLRGAQEWRGRIDSPTSVVEALISLAGNLVPRLSEVAHVVAPSYYGGFWNGGYRFDDGNVVETSRYFGILGLLFAVAALFGAWGTKQRRMVFVFAAVMAVVFSMLYRDDLTINTLRLIPFAGKGSYSRFITILSFMGCVLAGYGLYYTVRGRNRYLLAGVGAIGAYVLAAWWRIEDFAAGELWYPGLLAGGFLLVVLLRSRLGFDWIWIGRLAVTVSAADLMLTGYGFNTRMDNDRLFPTNNTIRYLLNDPEPYRVAVISDKPLYHPNILSYYDIPVVEGYLTVLPVAYAGYVKKLFPDTHITRNGILFLMEPNVEALRLLNVKYVLSDRPLGQRNEGLKHVIDSNNHGIYRVADHLPRVFCASHVFYENNEDDILDDYEDKLERFDAPVVLKGADGKEAYEGQCRVKNLEVYTHGLTADVESDGPRPLAIPYAYNENWRVKVNGEPVEVRKANGYHMAVRIPAGSSRIEMSYANRWNEISAWVLILGAGGLLLFAWRSRRCTGVDRRVLTAVAAVVIFKSSLSLPTVRNDRIPERAAPMEELEVYDQRVSRTAREALSDRIYADNALEMPLHMESEGLTRLWLLAGTFHQPTLDYPVTVEILDGAGRVLIDRRIEGEDVVNNGWLKLEFPPLSGGIDLRVRVSTEQRDNAEAFVLWLNDEGVLCVQGFYRLEAKDGGS